MSVTGTGGVAMGEMMPEMPEDDLPPIDDVEADVGDLEADMGGLEADVGDLEADLDMGDELGDELDDVGGGSVDLDTLRRVLDDCCPDKTEMVMSALEAEDGGDDLAGAEMGDDLDMGDDMDMGDDLGGVEECMEGGLSSAGMPEGHNMMPEGEDEFMESRVAEIANLITEDPDIFTSRRRRRRR